MDVQCDHSRGNPNPRFPQCPNEATCFYIIHREDGTVAKRTARCDKHHIDVEHLAPRARDKTFSVDKEYWVASAVMES